MIFSLHFSLIMAGYSACGILLGSYMMKYAGASELDLGFVFMIQPLTVFARPIINAQADRTQTHKTLLTWCVFANFLAYIPFMVLPFLLQDPQLAEWLTLKWRFWLLVSCHVIGSLAFTGIRSLGDALACNYAKRVNSDFTNYRKFGAISFGTCGFLLGQINQNWILPDFVPSFIMNVVCMFVLMTLIYFWPAEDFVICADNNTNKKNKQLNRDQMQVAKLKNCHPIDSNDREFSGFSCGKKSCSIEEFGSKSVEINEKQQKQYAHQQTSEESGEADATTGQNVKRIKLTAEQQVKIFCLLIKRDIRIPLFLLLLLYGGLVGYAPPNFVFTYVNVFCHEKGTCDAASLGGLMMICYCLCETICYMIISRLRSRMNYLILLEITLISLAFHYYFYGFLLPSLPPVFFIVESLHGLEYSSSLSSSVELAYKFANEVELLIPELTALGIISPSDDTELVKVSLMATMSGCFTFMYEGLGCIIGSFIFGLTTDYYSFRFTWILIGTLSSIGCVSVLVIILLGKCLKIKPQIEQLERPSSSSLDRQHHDHESNSVGVAS